MRGWMNYRQGRGNRTREAIINHPGMKAISFTGSTRAGARIASIAAPRFKKLSLELGGKNPSVIFADCNWDKMMKTSIQSSFTNQGRICLCTSRLIIEKSIYDKFKVEFVQRVKELVVGDPLEPNTKQGAVVSEVHFQKVMRCIETA